MVQTIELGEMARTSFEEEESAGRPQILAQLAKDISELIRNARGGRETEPLEAEATKTTSLERLRALQRKEPIVEPIVPVPAEPPYPPEAEKRQEFRCPDCGNFYLADANFCRHCGRRLSEVAAEAMRPWEAKTRERELEEEVERLRRANLALEEEVRKLQVAPSRKDGFFHEQGREAEASRRRPRQDVTELREDLQNQLQEIRQEVTRCARALQEPAAIPADEVLDIRQQLEALGEEVQQTSRVVASRDLRELDEVRFQLEAIQRQVSNTLSAAWSRPTEALPPARPPWPSSQPELNELRAEVNSLRAQLGQLSAKDRPAPGWKRRLGHTGRRVEPTLGSLAPEVAALHGRLTAIRTEVARVLQESQNCEESDPVLQAQLRVLLQELSNVRSDAATVAAGGSPCHWARSEPVALAPSANGGQFDARVEPVTGAPSSLFVCPHLTGDVTFGQTEAVLNGSGLSRPSSASSRDGRVGFQNSQPFQPPMHPPDRGPQHLPRRPSRSKLSEAEPATRRF